jgi:hypothetical protein
LRLLLRTSNHAALAEQPLPLKEVNFLGVPAVPQDTAETHGGEKLSAFGPGERSASPGDDIRLPPDVQFFVEGDVGGDRVDAARYRFIAPIEDSLVAKLKAAIGLVAG